MRNETGIVCFSLSLISYELKSNSITVNEEYATYFGYANGIIVLLKSLYDLRRMLDNLS